MVASVEAGMSRRQVMLVLFLVMPIALVTALVLTIGPTLQTRLRYAQPPVGAGAGATGGVNAIGEMLSGKAPNASAKGPMMAGAAGAAGAASDSAESAEVDPVTLEQGFYLVVEDKARKANASSPIFIAGNFNNWNAGDPEFKLEAQSDMRWRIKLIKPKSRMNPNEPIEFKFTRGSWELEELKNDMNPPGNRRLPKVDVSKLKAGEVPTIEMSVAHWGDERPDFKYKQLGDAGRTIEVAGGTLRRLQVAGGPVGPMARTPRDLLVWLPPGYEDPANATRDYPVLYMMDGQNLFEKPSTAPGEWQMDETAIGLITKGKIEPMIIVGIPHAGKWRTAEYLPPITTQPVVEDQGPAGEAFASWLLREIKPRVDRAFRTKQGSENTGIGGSSLGGLMSLYIGSKHPEVFGKVLAESPALTFKGNDHWKTLFAGVKQWPKSMYIGVGGKEAGDDAAASKKYAQAVADFYESLAKSGLGSDRVKYWLDKDALHNENAWAERLGPALTFLFPAKK